jgi:flagellar basal body-associated protein FliL
MTTIRSAASLLASIVCGACFAADPQPSEARPAGTPAGAPASTSATAPSPHFDPTAAVVAEGHFTYRQRDLDTLMLIAQRHARGKLSKADEERLRPLLLQALTAREALIDLLGGLPASLAGKGRDALILDLLEYQAEPATLRPPGGGAAAAAPASGAPAQQAAAPVPASAAIAASADGGVVLVRLPALSLTRTLEGIGRRQLVLGLALYFRDAALAKALEAKAPLIQDAILGYVQHLPPAQFAEPDQLRLKDGLIKAVTARVAEFPSDGILIPQLEANNPDAADGAH